MYLSLSTPLACSVRARERATEQPTRRVAVGAPAAEDDTRSACWPGPASARAGAGAPESAPAGGGGGGGGGVSSRELRALVRSQLGGDSAPSSPPASHRQGAGEGSCGGSARPHSAPFGGSGAVRGGEAGSEEGETPRNRARSRAGSALKRGRCVAEPDAVKVRALRCRLFGGQKMYMSLSLLCCRAQTLCWRELASSNEQPEPLKERQAQAGAEDCHCWDVRVPAQPRSQWPLCHTAGGGEPSVRQQARQSGSGGARGRSCGRGGLDVL